MKQFIYLLIPAMILASCGGGSKDPKAELAELKKQRADLDIKIKKLETAGGDKEGGKVTAVFVSPVQPSVFNAYIEVQSQITGDQVVNATARNIGTINRVYVQVGQHVSQGQVLATLDASVAEQQMKTLDPQIELAKSLYEKQQKLWEQNIGTEVQLMSAKTSYESLLKQKDAMKAGKDLNNIISPISGTVDAVSMKVGDMSQSPTAYIRVVNTSTLKAEASLGENYLGKVKQGDAAMLIFPDINDTVKTKVSYVSRSVDPMSRAFNVQVKLNDNAKLHPNMSCILKIANYTKENALVIPVSVIQKTSEGEMVYITEGNKAKSVMITTGRNANGMVEVLTGLKAGDNVIVAGFEDLDNGETISIQ